MDHPTAPSLLSEKIVLCDRNARLGHEPRIAALDKLSRFVRHHEDRIVRVHVDLERDPAAAEHNEYTAKGQLDLGGPALLASVSSDDPLRSLEFLLEKFDRQLSRPTRGVKTQRPLAAAG